MDTSEQPPSNLATRISECVGARFDEGWLPADLVHLVRRHTTQRQSRLATTAVAHHARHTDAPHRAPKVWVRQLVSLGIFDPATDRIVGGHADFLQKWAKTEKLHPDDALADAVAVYELIRTAPRLASIVAPPAAWGATNIGLPAEGAFADLDAKMLRTIRALLAKAEATDFEAEADAFTAKAQELMTRHSIDTAMLAAAAASPGLPSGVASSRVHLDSPYADEKATFLSVLADVNKVRCVYSQWSGFSTLVGFPVDIQLTEVLFTSLLVQATHASHVATSHDRRLSTASFKRAFLVSYADRIGERLADATRQVTTDAATTYGADLAPVLANRQSAVDAAYQAAFPDVTAMRPRSYNAAGWWAGRAAADHADLGAGEAITSG